MKCFSLIQYDLIKEYDNRITTLLRRMLNLKKLTLYLRVAWQGVFIAPMSLIKEFSMDLPQLDSFNFYLSVNYDKNDLVRYLSNNNLKQNSNNIGYKEVADIVALAFQTATYHVFTLPFHFTKLESIGNRFPNIVFNYVTELWVQDVVPFEHEFFLRVAQAFPLLKNFLICSLALSYPAKKSSKNIQSHQIVEYPHLISLDLTRADIDCVEQFLNETNTHLPCLAQLNVRYEELRIVTNDFTREATRRNCTNVTRLIFLQREIVGSKDYYVYFPLL